MAQAQVPRTFVSAQEGDDANSCSLNLPCRTFTKALTQVVAGGEVVALDSGDYEPFAIEKSVTVEAAPGVYAGITVTDAPFPMNIGVALGTGASDVVVLRGLTINGQGGVAGILFAGSSSARIVQIENCVINGMGQGIALHFEAAGQVLIKDTIVRNGNSSALNSSGIDLAGSGGIVTASIDHCRVENNGFGIYARANTRVTVRDSIIAGNNAGPEQVGLLAHVTTARSAAVLNIENCLVTGNSYGIVAGQSNSTIRVSNSTITSNTRGLQSAGSGLILSRKNNTLEGNGLNGNFNAPFNAQ
jgi:nitrous oxidase accessory protein NosD